MKLFTLLASLTSALAAVIPRDAAPSGAVAPGVELRILPLGASITAGYRSPDGNGFRLQLQKRLSKDTVRFAGVERDGTMADNWHAGYPGYTISRVAGKANKSLVQRPNVVLIHVGTNDMRPQETSAPKSEAPARLGDLIDQIHDTCPDAVVLIALIINAADPKQEANIKEFNKALPGVVAQRRSKGVKVVTVDFQSIGPSDEVDGTHPNGPTYSRMGDIWYDALRGLPAGWITKPVGPDPHINNPYPQA